MTLFNLASTCPLCSLSHRTQHTVCARCIQYFEPIKTACPRCRTHLNTTELCGRCLSAPRFYERIYCGYYYTQPLKHLLHQYKFHHHLFLTQFLADLILNNAQLNLDNKPQCIIPVPLHPKRLNLRGFNQAHELAKALSHKTHIPTEPQVCHKVTHTKNQTELNAHQRQSNLIHAFESQVLAYDNIVLVDDIVTTGSTVNALSQSIKRVNPTVKINIWCAVRTKFIH